MDRTVYVNGQFVAADNARVSVFDRGFLFGDGVYEVIPVVRHKLVDKAHAMARLQRSLDAVSLSWPCSPEALLGILGELLRRDSVQEGYVYLQVTRGSAERDFAFPVDTPVTLVAWSTARPVLENPLAASGVNVVSVEDLRWKRRDIKSVSMLAQCLAKEEARRRGAFEGWMVENDVVTEGVSSSAFIIKDGVLITRPLSRSILPGIRRQVLLELVRGSGIALQERNFTLQEAYAADEAFMSSATALVLPIITIDGHRIGSGCPGPLALKLRALYVNKLLEEAAS